MKRGRYIKFNIIFFLMLIFLPQTCYASIPNPPTTYYLDDLNMLDDATKQHIKVTNRELEQKTGSQIVVVTLSNPSGLPASDLAVDIFNSWEIGSESKKNGVLILITRDYFNNKSEVFIATGYGIEGRLNDGKVGRIIDNFMLDDLKAGDYSEAIYHGFNAIAAEVAAEYGVDLDGDFDYYLRANRKSAGISIVKILIYLFLFIMISRWYAELSMHTPYYRNDPRYRRYDGNPYRGGRSRTIGSWTSSSSSSWSSSSSSGSSGGFRGGGGSTGGGGAGRSF